MTSRVHAGYVIVVELALLCETAQTAQTDGGVAHFQVKGAARKFTGDLANKSVDETARFVRHQRIIINAPQTNFVARRRVLKNHPTIG